MKKLIYLIRPVFIIRFAICKLRSFYYTWKYIDDGNGRIVFKDPFLKVKIKKHITSKLIINGNFRISPFMEGNNPIVISMSSNSTLHIKSDFIIGQGVRFFLMPNSTLIIGGKELESDSGITSETLIMVYKKIEIGKDFLCAWDIFISDSDWHQICDQNHQADVKIGDHVWIANNNNILKGTNIGKNSIVASNSKIINKTFPDNVLIGGLPAIILKTNINWKRDIVNSLVL